MNLLGSLTLVEIECANCITHFAMDASLKRRCQETGREFYCPNGHSNVYRSNELDKLRKENKILKDREYWNEQSLKRTQENLEIAKKERTSLKGQLTKTRKRIANGVCPCCHRNFQQLAKHMDSKHPDFKAVVG